jgi:hypothetical protein
MEEGINNFKLISLTIKYKKLGFTYEGISELLHVSKAKIKSMVKFKILLKDFASKERQETFNKLSREALMVLLTLKKSNNKERYYYVIRRLVEESKIKEKLTKRDILRIINEYERNKALKIKKEVIAQ